MEKEKILQRFLLILLFLFRDVGRVRNWTILYRDFFGVTIETSRGQVKEEDKNLPTIFYLMLHVLGRWGWKVSFFFLVVRFFFI